jgi:hypothetical protein
MRAALMTAAVAVAFAVAAAAPAGNAPGRLAGPERVYLRQYKELTAADVYRAAAAGSTVDVRFRDTFLEAAAPHEAADQTEARGYSYLVLAAFRTQGELLCLVPLSSADALRLLYGTAPGRPLSAAALAGPMAVQPGTELQVDGVLVHQVPGERAVLVDAIRLGGSPPPVGRKEVQVRGAGLAEPLVFEGPGERLIELFCTGVRGKLDPLTVTVEEVDRRQVAARVAELMGRAEGGTYPKEYGPHAPVTVYRRAGEEAPVNVEFTDAVGDVLPLPVADDLSVVPAVRSGVQVDVPVAAVFETAGRITCLVPLAWPTLCRQAAGLLPGERVLVRGTTVGPIGARNCVLVDYFEVVSVGRPPRDTWWVTVSRGDEWMGISMWDCGSYDLTSVPCANRPGWYERVHVWFGEYLSGAPAAPAPAAVPQGRTEAPADTAHARGG